MTHERKIPLRLEQEKALARRIPEVHPQLPKILNSIEAKKAGLRGEQNLDYHLSFFPEKIYDPPRYPSDRSICLSNGYSLNLSMVNHPN